MDTAIEGATGAGPEATATLEVWVEASIVVVGAACQMPGR